MNENDIKLNFLKRVLTDTTYDDRIREDFFSKKSYPDKQTMLSVIKKPVDLERKKGMDWPERAHTMIGLMRLDNLHFCLDEIRKQGTEGDVLETGVWRGGACIFMKCYLDLWGMSKKVFVADSFQGLPPPEHEKDAGDGHHEVDFLRVSQDQVRENFLAYGCDLDGVKFIKGWFSDTLKGNTDIVKLSILRMDGDMYKSTMDVFDSCYDKIQHGGFVIVDDFCIRNCNDAVMDFRAMRNINKPFTPVDVCGIYWQID